MATTRSPRYPNVSLSEAITKAKNIYEKEHMSPLTPQVAAEAMGYGGLHGASLKMISSLKKYGLLEGRGEDVRLTKDAQCLVIDNPDSPDYQAAIRRAALSPDIYGDIYKQFRDGGSERNISVFLEKQGFKPDAAASVARNYKETMALVSGGLDAYNDTEDASTNATSPTMNQPQTTNPTATRSSPGAFLRSAEGVPVGATDAPYRIIQDGKRLHITASVDIVGLQMLKKMLEKYEQLLKLLDPDGAPGDAGGSS